MKYKLIVLSTILASLLFGSCNSSKIVQAIPENWANTAASEDFEIYVDLSSIKREGSIVYAREKRIYTSPEDRAKYVENIASKGLKMYKIERWNDFSYCIYEYECDCANKKSRIVAVEDYDSTGKLILRTAVDPKKRKTLAWKDVEPDTVEDYTFFLVCDYEDLKSNAEPTP